jgi:small-conductance mechanosensitive channel
MIACVGPTALSYEDTYNTLKYASRARTIKTKIAKTTLNFDAHVGHYQILLQEREAKLAEIEKRNDQLAREAQQLRNLAKPALPTESDLGSWIQKLVALFFAKKEIHEQILKLESKEKITRWRIKYNHERVHAVDSSDDDEVSLSIIPNRALAAIAACTKVRRLM